jgi:hypothetical protein
VYTPEARQVLDRIVNRQLTVIRIAISLPDGLMPHLLSRKIITNTIFAEECRPSVAQRVKVGVAAFRAATNR